MSRWIHKVSPPWISDDYVTFGFTYPVRIDHYDLCRISTVKFGDTLLYPLIRSVMPYDTLEFVHVSFFTMTYVTFGYTLSSHLWFHLGFAHGFLSHSSVRTSGTLDPFLVISREREG